MTDMKILVYGAGVLGSLYAAKLKDTGHDVAVLARGRRLEAIRTHGIVLHDDRTGRRSNTPVPTVEGLAPDAAYDLILVVMRKNQVPAVLPSLAANRVTPAVLFLVNNGAGPGDWAAALGSERVLLGFPGAGGAREGHVVRYSLVDGKKQPTTIGELDGRLTPRLKTIASALQEAGFPVAIEPNMDAWLRTHVAAVIPAGLAILMAGGSTRALADFPGGIALTLQATREALSALPKLGIPITPGKIRLLLWLPSFLMLPIIRRALRTERAELVMARHTVNAGDEIAHLAGELMALVRKAGTPAPALEQLFQYAGADAAASSAKGTT
jgi:2-dehydropantoate 2-reductase